MPIAIAEERPDTPDACALIAELDDVLNPLYPQESRHGFSVDKLLRDGVAFFVARVDGRAAGCAGVLLVGGAYGEVKRMYVRPDFRGAGVAKQLLARVAEHCRDRRIDVLRLETGIHQTEAIALYERSGFYRISPFAPYREDPVSRCYEKRLG
jgi:ribosomal protein S18 acetylase RimI-like enzyme